MYESYAWPGAHSFKEELKMLINWMKSSLCAFNKRIKAVDRGLEG